MHARAATFVPADFAAEQPLAQIAVTRTDLPPRVSGVLIRCQGFVELDGRLTDSFCLSDVRAFRVLFRKVMAVLPKQRFTPARVDGAPVRVLMSFGVVSECSATRCYVTLVRNHGYYRETYGLTYVAPQPILPSNEWYDGFDYKLMWIRGRGYRAYRSGHSPIYNRQFVVAAAIDAKGRSQDACLYKDYSFQNVAPPDLRRALERVIESIGSVRLIPGFLGNEPTAMTLYESSVANDTADANRGQYALGGLECESAAARSR